jgi:hypothetical protein
MPSKKSIERQYRIIIPYLEEAVRYMESLLKFLPSDDFLLETNIKPLPSIIRKMNDRGEKNLLKLVDLIRGYLFYSPNYTEGDVYRLLKQVAGSKVKKVDPRKNRGFDLKNKCALYIDFQVGALTFQLQVIPIEFKPYKGVLHRIYEKLRDEKHLTKQQKEKLQALHNKIYDDLSQKVKENRKS